MYDADTVTPTPSVTADVDDAGVLFSFHGPVEWLYLPWEKIDALVSEVRRQRALLHTDLVTVRIAE